MTLENRIKGFYALAAGLSLAVNIGCYSSQAKNTAENEPQQKVIEQVKENLHKKIDAAFDDPKMRDLAASNLAYGEGVGRAGGYVIHSAMVDFNYDKQFNGGDVYRFFLHEKPDVIAKQLGVTREELFNAYKWRFDEYNPGLREGQYAKSLKLPNLYDKDGVGYGN